MSINFESKYFQKFQFKQDQLKTLLRVASRDIKIARQSDIAEVRFQFSYNALIKMGMALISDFGYRVNARTGHHAKTLEKFAAILGDESIIAIGNQMRKKRNIDLYDGGIMISKKEADQYLNWVAEVFKKVEDYLSGGQKLF